MTENERIFLKVLRAALAQEEPALPKTLSGEAWDALFALAARQNVLPLVYAAVIAAPAGSAMDADRRASIRRQAMRLITLQARRTDAFVSVYRSLTDAGLRPLVVKGIVARSLYPEPDLRISGDEDLLIPEEDFAACHAALMACGMEPLSPQEESGAAFEAGYRRADGTLYIELHQQFFSPASDSYKDLNAFFTQVHARAVTIRLEECTFYTPAPTDHLLYLILHAFKHFLHGGFGLRQVCDIILYADAYGDGIDWAYLYACCRQARAERFAAALFRIGEKYLTFDPVRAGYPDDWRGLSPDEGPLLADLLDAGAFGRSTRSREHSATMTLSAAAASRAGSRVYGGTIRGSLFPPADELAGRYPYLKQHPRLVPFAWVSRILHYRRELKEHADGDSAAEAVRIGKERVELLRRYGIID